MNIDNNTTTRQNFASLMNNVWSSALANTASSKKRAKQAVVRRERNLGQKSTLRTALKKVVKAASAGNKEDAQAALKAAAKLADSAVSKKLIHANKAARLKSRLNAKIKAIS